MLTKLSTFRGVTPAGEPLVQLFHQGDSIEKVAGRYQPEVRDWLSTYKSDKDQIALLVNAMGGSEYWGQNVNGDIWPWMSLAHDCKGRRPEEYPYDEFYGKRIPPYGFRTFLDAHPFVHHRNKDPNRAFGSVAVSTLNKVMKRVELVVLIDRKRAAMHDAQPFVDRVDAGEFPDVSMGARVPFDVCAVCRHKSKTKNDYCVHVKELGMNHILPDGRRVGVINLHPRFFDISFVFIGADRTAKVMCKLASGLWVPESVAEGERIYEIRDAEPGLVKAASLDSKYLVGEDGVPRTKEELAAIYANKLIAAKKRSTEVGYGDGVLRTNAADGVDTEDAQKEAAFLEITRSAADTEGVDHGYAQKDEGTRGDPNDPGPSSKCDREGSVYVPGPGGGRCTVPRDDSGDDGGDGRGRGEEAEVTKAAANTLAFKGKGTTFDAATKGLLSGAVGGSLGIGAMGVLRAKGIPPNLLRTMAHAAGEWGLAGGATNTAMHLMNKKAMVKKLQAPPHREGYPFAGQYKWNGMTILVENPKGTWRQGKNWKTHMKFDYGEIEGSLGSDGDPVDVYVGPNEKAQNVYIVHQNHAMGPKKGEYDEDKVMLGFNDARAAKKAYLAHYDRPTFFRSITEMPLTQFKKMIFRKEAEGEKIAVDKEKKAIDLKLEDLFDAPNAVRRERVWKDKVTGDSSYHTGSGLGKSFSTMQKTASAEEVDEKLAQIFKVSDSKMAAKKLADVVKEIAPDVTTGRVVEDLTAREKKLPKDVLDDAGKKSIECALSTPSMMGMVLKPEEFQRILLSAIGKSGLADELDDKNLTFPVGGCDSCAPCGELGPDHFDKDLMQKLLPMMEGRSYLGPVVRRRIIRITIIPKEESASEGVDSPLLSKVGAAYNWYRNEMLKAATYAPEAVSSNPELHAKVWDVGASDLFNKSAGIESVGINRNTVGAVIASVPLALMYSAALRRDIEEGQDVGLLKTLIADHPNLTAMGSGALVRELMKHPRLNQIVGNIGKELMETGRRITGGA